MKNFQAYIRLAVLAAIPAVLVACSDTKITYGGASCKNAESVTDEYRADQAALQADQMTASNYFDLAVFDHVKSFTDVCPGNTALVEVEILWDEAATHPVYFGMELTYEQQGIGEVPLEWTTEGPTSVIRGQATVEFPKGSTSGAFTYALKVTFRNPDGLGVYTIYDEWFTPFIREIVIKTTYSKQ